MRRRCTRARSFSLSPPQLAILVRAGQGLRPRIEGPDDEAACLALWRAGLLRLNGESSFQLSQLGRAAIQAQTADRRSDAIGGSGERALGRRRPTDASQQEAARF